MREGSVEPLFSILNTFQTVFKIDILMEQGTIRKDIGGNRVEN
jgi:hypothetical protein